MGLNNGGYTFLNPADLPTLTNDEIQPIHTDKTNFLFRSGKAIGNSAQPYAVLRQVAPNK